MCSLKSNHFSISIKHTSNELGIAAGILKVISTGESLPAVLLVRERAFGSRTSSICSPTLGKGLHPEGLLITTSVRLRGCASTPPVDAHTINSIRKQIWVKNSLANTFLSKPRNSLCSFSEGSIILTYLPREDTNTCTRKATK